MDTTPTRGAIPPPAYCQTLKDSDLWVTSLGLLFPPANNIATDFLEIDDSDTNRMDRLAKDIPIKTLQVSVEFVRYQTVLAASGVAPSPEVKQKLVEHLEDIDNFGATYCNLNAGWTLSGTASTGDLSAGYPADPFK